ncbi:stalk domain-containing protein [Paenibacillus doosanensis]|uniref:stalk domain-containing protein n=1 Tax=Paenibacillus doosanensis TaxID=1229154 RepID=UPI00217F233F|nr:stalk domain-containing protein [Paenibacillus doosanensis]MCS7460765.1 stalk domain-containing protein [Paenibacillus doosanensis]
MEYAFNLQTLFIPGENISDLKPIGSLYNLTFLVLNNNQIRDICPVAGLYKLKRLVVSDNQIEDIGCLSRMNSLTDLLASDNKITSIAPLAKLNIEWLGLEGNPIEDITAVSSMNKLKHLYVDGSALNAPSKSLVSRFEQSGVAVNRGQAETDTISGVSVFVQDVRVLFERAPIIDDGTTLVQFRPLFEKLGFAVKWDEDTRSIRAEKAGTSLIMQADHTEAVLNGDTVTLEVAPRNVDGSMMVPVRFVSEASHLEATWDQRAKAVYLWPDRTITAPSGLFSIKVGGKWVAKSPVSKINYDLYMENGSKVLMAFVERKADIEDGFTLDDYEAALKESLEKVNIKPSETKSITVDHMNARQLSYSMESANGAKYEYVLTIAEGQYNFFRMGVASTDAIGTETEQDYENILQSLKELKTTDQLSEEKFGALKPVERVLDAARYYRELGFFAGDQSLSGQQFDDKFKKVHEELKGENWDPFDSSEYYDSLAELYILGEDKKRVWLKDTEADVGEGNEIYARTLKQWSDISRGAFQPTEIQENWKSKEGPVEISFMLNGKKRTIHPQYMNDFIDVGILAEINEMIQDSGYQFVCVEIDQTVFVTVLNASEKDKISKDRFLPFSENI